VPFAGACRLEANVHRSIVRVESRVDIGADFEGLRTDGRPEPRQYCFWVDTHGVHRGFQNPHLLLDAAIEFAVILMPPARGDQEEIGKLFEEGLNGFGAAARLIEEVETPLRRSFSVLI